MSRFDRWSQLDRAWVIEYWNTRDAMDAIDAQDRENKMLQNSLKRKKG